MWRTYVKGLALLFNLLVRPQTSPILVSPHSTCASCIGAGSDGGGVGYRWIDQHLGHRRVAVISAQSSSTNLHKYFLQMPLIDVAASRIHVVGRVSTLISVTRGSFALLVNFNVISREKCRQWRSQSTLLTPLLKKTKQVTLNQLKSEER